MVASAEVVAVIGGGGELGRAVVNELRAHEYDVRESLPEMVSLDAVAVIDLSGFVVQRVSLPDGFAEFEATLAENVEPTVKLLSALQPTAKDKLRSVVHVSTADAADPSSYYAASKLAAEKYLALFANATGVPSVSVRIPVGGQLNMESAAKAVVEALQKGASGVISLSA